MKQKLIYLIRHGEPELGPGNERRFLGQLDLPLSSRGIQQSESLSKKLENHSFENIYCSDLQRTYMTAKIIAGHQGAEPIPCAGLREVNLGEWEGLPFDEVYRRQPIEFQKRGQDLANYCPPGGESFADCSQRVIQAFEEIAAATSDNALIVGHAGSNRLILCHLLELPISKLFRIEQNYCCLNIVSYYNHQWLIKLLNA